MEIKCKLIYDTENGKMYRCQLDKNTILTIRYWKNFKGCELFLREAIIHITEYLPREEFLELKNEAKEVIRILEPKANLDNINYIKVNKTTEEHIRELMK